MKIRILVGLFFITWLNPLFSQNQYNNFGFNTGVSGFKNPQIKWEGNSSRESLEASILGLKQAKYTVDSPMVKINITPDDSNYIAPERFKTRIPQSLIIPGILIAYGLTTAGDNGLYSSRKARTDLLKLTGGHGGPIDDYLIVAPYVEFGMLLLFKVQCRNDFRNTALLIAKSEALMLLLTYSLKYATKEERPYSYQKGLDGVSLAERKESPGAFESFPSGHTAEAFVAATIVYREYRYISKWYGVGAYAIAATVGAYRMINDRHWQNDVLVGAGIGILSANVVYATHQHRWGRNEVCLSPMYDGHNKGLLFSFRF